MSARAISVLRQSGGASVVALLGEHDLSSADEVRSALDAARTNGHAVIVDLSNTEFIDSAVIGVLIASQREVTADGAEWAAVVGNGTGTAVRRIFELTGLDELMPVYETTDEALMATSAADSETTEV